MERPGSHSYRGCGWVWGGGGGGSHTCCMGGGDPGSVPRGRKGLGTPTGSQLCSSPVPTAEENQTKQKTSDSLSLPPQLQGPIPP